ncbi:transposase [Planomonospora parontospora]|uniref:transposase n=1 Tax=Planomonospora parontospora TaxID=58119 RepID=UPI0019410240|nr:transposase [Planomonospora parontospora]GGL10253.1 transposase [Planomonospora parontospora subsp. antibiotica]GII14735.1 transposase [Planomonospora parontospora subsp. antibiotica]
MGELRSIADPFTVPGPAGVAIRDRLRLSEADAAVLAEVGAFLGALASRDLKTRCAAGREHDTAAWAARKRELTVASSARWAGSITKATNDQWALARRAQLDRLQKLEAGIAVLRHRLSQPLGAPGTNRAPGGYRSKAERHAKQRRLHLLEARCAAVRRDWEAGRVRVCRGGKRLATTRHHLEQADLTEEKWRERWRAARLFLSADGESGKRFGNETIRLSPDGEISIRLPSALAHLANAPHGRYVLSCTVRFAHRGAEWADRITADKAVAYTIGYDAVRGRWYATASWQRPPAPVLPVEAALAGGCLGVDANNDHLAAWRLDAHGNPVGAPRRFAYDLSGSAQHRDAQVRHALSGLLHWARQCGVKAIAIEDLDFTNDKTREKHGRRKRFRNLISRFPTAKLRNRLVAMAAEQDVAVVAVDPAYTSRWGAEHWQRPMSAPRRRVTRHEAASIAIARRALGHAIRRRTTRPPGDRSDHQRLRDVQAGEHAPERGQGTRPPDPDRPRGGPPPGGT